MIVSIIVLANEIKDKINEKDFEFEDSYVETEFDLECHFENEVCYTNIIRYVVCSNNYYII